MKKGEKRKRLASSKASSSAKASSSYQSFSEDDLSDEDERYVHVDENSINKRFVRVGQDKDRHERKTKRVRRDYQTVANDESDEEEQNGQSSSNSLQSLIDETLPSSPDSLTSGSVDNFSQQNDTSYSSDRDDSQDDDDEQIPEQYKSANANTDEALGNLKQIYFDMHLPGYEDRESLFHELRKNNPSYSMHLFANGKNELIVPEWQQAHQEHMKAMLQQKLELLSEVPENEEGGESDESHLRENGRQLQELQRMSQRYQQPLTTETLERDVLNDEEHSLMSVNIPPQSVQNYYKIFSKQSPISDCFICSHGNIISAERLRESCKRWETMWLSNGVSPSVVNITSATAIMLDFIETIKYPFDIDVLISQGVIEPSTKKIHMEKLTELTKKSLCPGWSVQSIIDHFRTHVSSPRLNLALNRAWTQELLQTIVENGFFRAPVAFAGNPANNQLVLKKSAVDAYCRVVSTTMDLMKAEQLLLQSENPAVVATTNIYTGKQKFKILPSVSEAQKTPSNSPSAFNPRSSVSLF